ncbi:hypothetical protein FYK55_09465 [Roseiconus nitratireducens]|uniref:Uncharacterized protein n=1 Tax=Roseiconus nitratireducens TaxID=2605748 RepID=A0A5M6DDR4_9BACT|nr:hypothetical protein [Roseiconus nitratireducens]KAA5544540.1 hypothetical protein FYK55_09465 [Roseiconus nitratireducens]
MSTTEPAEFRPPSPATRLGRVGDGDGTLGPADFQRIGISPRETRSAVIRRAAARTSQSLASKQLRCPSVATEEQLFRVALSTYRLLDPRQRGNDHARAHLGRIRQGDLMSAERAAFAIVQPTKHDDVASPSHADVPATEQSWPPRMNATLDAGRNDATKSALRHLEYQPVATAHASDSRPQPAVESTSVAPPPAEIGTSVPHSAPAVTRMRRRLRQPAVIVSIMVLVLSAAVGLSVWKYIRGQSVRAIRDRYSQVDG